MATPKIGRKPLAHGVRYPWNEWFSKRRVVLRRGVHFHGLVHGMAATIRQAATRLGVGVSIEVDKDNPDRLILSRK